MAKRDRVPRHKSQSHVRNKNPKLSPFQREQKRAKLANQAPTLKTQGSINDIPHSQRRLYAILQAQRERQQARRQAQLASREGEEEVSKATAAAAATHEDHSEATNSAVTEGTTSSAAEALDDKNAQSSSVEGGADTTAVAAAPKKKRAAKSPVATESLNAELLRSVGPVFAGVAPSSADAEDPSRPRTVEEIIARKKERKHAKKSAARQVKVTERVQNVDEQLRHLLERRSRKTKAKAGEDFNLAFERKLRQLQQEKAQQQAAEARARKAAETKKARGTGTRASAAADHDDAAPRTASSPKSGDHASSHPPQRKKITFVGGGDAGGSADAADDPPHHAMQYPKDTSAAGQRKRRPQDFYELVDVVRYGERVSAPPVFDVLPNRNAAVSRLATKLERESARGAATERHRLLSGGGGYGEQRRLASLGLAPAVTSTVSDAVASKTSKEREMALLRAKVMATYRSKKNSEVEKKKGVDMKHQFPAFSS